MADLVCAHLTRSRTSLDTWTPLGQLKRPCMTFCIILRVKTPGCPCSCSNKGHHLSSSPGWLCSCTMTWLASGCCRHPGWMAAETDCTQPAASHKIQAAPKLSIGVDMASIVQKESGISARPHAANSSKQLNEGTLVRQENLCSKPCSLCCRSCMGPDHSNYRGCCTQHRVQKRIWQRGQQGLHPHEAGEGQMGGNGGGRGGCRGHRQQECLMRCVVVVGCCTGKGWCVHHYIWWETAAHACSGSSAGGNHRVLMEGSCKCTPAVMQAL